VKALIRLESETDFDGWRVAARRLLAAEFEPDNVEWLLPNRADLFSDTAAWEGPEEAELRVPAEFISLARYAVMHRDPSHYAFLYRLLWRITRDPPLWRFGIDPDIVRLRKMEKEVRRDIYTMKAFVRFREIELDGETQYIAWFEPEHHTLEAVAPFFVRRFAALRWSVLTPERSIRWNGEALELLPGARRTDAPAGDAREELWRGYYRSIFNPARLKVAHMQSQMPRKLWRNLPEASLIPQLVAEARPREARMIETPAYAPVRDWTVPRAMEAAPRDAWEALDVGVRKCRGCPLWEAATQAVHGEGPRSARVMLVGEQPGDQEDLAGRVFVGPAGQLLDRALQAAEIERDNLYVTNAVRHFKFELRGRRRIHKTPAQREVDACNRWLSDEIDLLRPALIVALGATAAKALIGRPVKIAEARGRLIPLEHRSLLITAHPSALLRLPVEQQAAAFEAFVSDLRLIAAAL
jgi:uracil-DNA glycosylase